MKSYNNRQNQSDMIENQTVNNQQINNRQKQFDVFRESINNQVNTRRNNKVNNKQNQGDS